MVPEDLKYTPTHEWCRIEGDVATIGVTEVALKDLGSVIYVSLPDQDADVLEEISFGEIEGMEGTTDILSPFDGAVEAVNTRVAHNPDLVAEDPYDAGWLIKLRLDEPAEVEGLLSAEEYEQIAKKRR